MFVHPLPANVSRIDQLTGCDCKHTLEQTFNYDVPTKFDQRRLNGCQTPTSHMPVDNWTPRPTAQQRATPHVLCTRTGPGLPPEFHRILCVHFPLRIITHTHTNKNTREGALFMCLPPVPSRQSTELCIRVNYA